MEEQAQAALNHMAGINMHVDPYAATVAQTTYNIFSSMSQEATEDKQAFEETLLDDLKAEIDDMETPENGQ
jgi:hypothetical protein